MAEVRNKGRVNDMVMIPNHPSRLGIDSPHEIRAWIDAAPDIVIGMEGAPGHQAAGLPAPHSSADGGARGLYGNSAATYSHNVYLDTSVRGPGSDFDARGRTEDPVYSGTVDLQENDFWPGYYSRMHVGAREVSYGSVMEGLREGRVWVDHGCLLDSIEVTVTDGAKSATLGGELTAKRGRKVSLTVTIVPASKPNFAGFVPELARVDVIMGTVSGPVADRDAMTAPDTRGITQLPAADLSVKDGTISWTQVLEAPSEKFYVRLRGTDGKRSQTGFLGATIDPAGPAIDEPGNADPWQDLWFYTNPIFVGITD